MKDNMPNLNELKQMIRFCENHAKIYIYGCASNQEYLLKYFDCCGVKIDGYITTYSDDRELIYRDIPKFTLDLADLEDAGIIIGLSDKYYDDVMPRLHKRRCTDYFLMSEFNKKAIANTMRPRKKDDFGILVQLAEHCNLNCQMCCTFSPFAKEEFLDTDIFESDMARLAELTNKQLRRLFLQGGEPLLNPLIADYTGIARRCFPNTPISIFTNGILLANPPSNRAETDFWLSCKETDIEITVTRYPIDIDYEYIKAKGRQYDVKVNIFIDVNYHESPEKFMFKPALNSHKNASSYEFITCFFINECNVLKKGTIYGCPISANIEHLNRYFNLNHEITEQDCIDIYRANSFEEIAELSARRVPFCGYCELSNRDYIYPWKLSGKTLNEYFD